MGNVRDYQRDSLLTLLRGATVAAGAGVNSTVWANSTTGQRVMVGDPGTGYVRGLHRGRLPAIVIFDAGYQTTHETTGGGTLAVSWKVQIHSAAPTQDAALSALHDILAPALAAIRGAAYWALGAEEIAPLQIGVLGHYLEITVTSAHSYGRDTYEDA